MVYSYAALYMGVGMRKFAGEKFRVKEETHNNV
jgi:hypothetical protein